MRGAPRRHNARGTAQGIILVDKPPGMTSFQSLAAIKRGLCTPRVGHAGTLDRFAEGLLLVLSGRMTRLSAFATGLGKEYTAAVTFGKGTDTLDPEGAVIAEGPVPEREALEAVLEEFRGTILQVPPAFSAVHVGGRRAYEAARKGQIPRISPREVTIARLDILDFDPPTARLSIECSKGTYVRSLARDIASRLGTCAFVSRLRRTRIAGFRIEEAVDPREFDPDRDLRPAESFFEAVPDLGRLVLKDEWVESMFAGRQIREDFFMTPPLKDGIFGAFTRGGRLVGVLERRCTSWRYAAVFPDESA
jgi:tRNA pseudouridine55 synthase